MPGERSISPQIISMTSPDATIAVAHRNPAIVSRLLLVRNAGLVKAK